MASAATESNTIGHRTYAFPNSKTIINQKSDRNALFNYFAKGLTDFFFTFDHENMKKSLQELTNVELLNNSSSDQISRQVVAFQELMYLSKSRSHSKFKAFVQLDLANNQLVFQFRIHGITESLDVNYPALKTSKKHPFFLEFTFNFSCLFLPIEHGGEDILFTEFELEDNKNNSYMNDEDYKRLPEESHWIKDWNEAVQDIVSIITESREAFIKEQQEEQLKHATLLQQTKILRSSCYTDTKQECQQQVPPSIPVTAKDQAEAALPYPIPTRSFTQETRPEIAIYHRGSATQIAQPPCSVSHEAECRDATEKLKKMLSLGGQAPDLYPSQGNRFTQLPRRQSMLEMLDEIKQKQKMQRDKQGEKQTANPAPVPAPISFQGEQLCSIKGDLHYLKGTAVQKRCVSLTEQIQLLWFEDIEVLSDKLRLSLLKKDFGNEDIDKFLSPVDNSKMNNNFVFKYRGNLLDYPPLGLLGFLEACATFLNKVLKIEHIKLRIE